MNAFASFRNDPFFSGVDLPSQALSLDHRSRHDNHDRQISQRQHDGDQISSLFENPFAMMQSMMSNMGQMFNQIDPQMLSQGSSGRNGQGLSFSSATVMSMDRRNPNQPRIFQATSEQLRGPEGKYHA
jgi:hypothetical protein